jgi:hypothetical protein
MPSLDINRIAQTTKILKKLDFYYMYIDSSYQMKQAKQEIIDGIKEIKEVIKPTDEEIRKAIKAAYGDHEDWTRSALSRFDLD